jgi:hypothetical protein
MYIKCIGKVDGAKNIPTPVLEQFCLSEHIKQLVKERK